MKKKFKNCKTIIIFTGAPGTGKSVTSDKLLHYLDNDEIVKISYDQIKEKNWDIFGYNNEEQKDDLNWWSLEEFYLTIQKKMWENNTILIEYPFYQRHKKKLQKLIEENDYSAVTIYLYADMHTLYSRSVNRDHKEDRHPGHFLENYHKETYRENLKNDVLVDKTSFETFVGAISHKEYNVQLGLNIPIDVTNFMNINYEDIYQKIVLYQN